jgi:hypothetical protein
LRLKAAYLIIKFFNSTNSIRIKLKKYIKIVLNNKNIYNSYKTTMAHFAALDENNVVTQVIVVANEDTADVNGNEVEEIGVAFCKKLLGADTNWKQTSYNTYFNTHKGGKTPFRANYAVIGGKYDEELDVFLYKQPNHD